MRHRTLAVMLVIAVVFTAPAFVAGQAPSGTKKFDETAINTDAAIKAAVETAKAAAATTNWIPVSSVCPLTALRVSGKS